MVPLSWGDPLYRLPALGLVVYHRLFEEFDVNYAVDESNRVVYLRWLRRWKTMIFLRPRRVA